MKNHCKYTVNTNFQTVRVVNIKIIEFDRNKNINLSILQYRKEIHVYMMQGLRYSASEKLTTHTINLVLKILFHFQCHISNSLHHILPPGPHRS